MGLLYSVRMICARYQVLSYFTDILNEEQSRTLFRSYAADEGEGTDHLSRQRTQLYPALARYQAVDRPAMN